MNNSLISFAEHMRGCLTTGLSPHRMLNSGCRPQYPCPQLRRRVLEARILLSGNAISRSTKAMSQSEKGSLRLFFAISSEKTEVIPVQNGNVAMKNRNVAFDKGKVEVGERNGSTSYKLPWCQDNTLMKEQKAYTIFWPWKYTIDDLLTNEVGIAFDFKLESCADNI